MSQDPIEQSPENEPSDPLWIWQPDSVWFRPLIPSDLPWGSEEYLEKVPPEATGLYGVKVGSSSVVDDQRYEKGEIVTVGSRSELYRLIGALSSMTDLIFPWYDRLVTSGLVAPHLTPIDPNRYRRDCTRGFVKGLLISLLCAAGFVFAPQLALVFFIFGTFSGLYPMSEAVVIWLYRLDRLSVDALNRRMVNVEFFRLWMGTRQSRGLTVGLVIMASVFVCQMLVGTPQSIEAAALVKSRVLEQGEWWRIVTTGLMHGNILHIAFNGMALYSLGRLLVALVSPGLLSFVFLATVVTGSLASLWLGPGQASVGASGGIIGCLGFLLVVTIKFRREIPSSLQSSLIQACAVLVIYGLVGSAVIDNAAHAGGFVGGVLLGVICLPWLRLAPTSERGIVKVLSLLSMMVLALGTGKVLWELWKVLPS